jgi:hypothetical protein
MAASLLLLPLGLQLAAIDPLRAANRNPRRISRLSGDSENWSGGDTKTGPPCGANH